MLRWVSRGWGVEVTQGIVLFVDEESGAELFMDRLADAIRGHMA